MRKLTKMFPQLLRKLTKMFPQLLATIWMAHFLLQKVCTIIVHINRKLKHFIQKKGYTAVQQKLDKLCNRTNRDNWDSRYCIVLKTRTSQWTGHLSNWISDSMDWFYKIYIKKIIFNEKNNFKILNQDSKLTKYANFFHLYTR